MTPEHVIEIITESLVLIIKISALPLMTALVVGVVISLVQAVTQIQEMTLTFVPKMIALFVCIMLTMPFMLKTLTNFTEQLFAQIVVEK